MKTKNKPIIACHPPLRICWILPEVNYEWVKEMLLEYKPKPHLGSRHRIPESNKHKKYLVKFSILLIH